MNKHELWRKRLDITVEVSLAKIEATSKRNGMLPLTPAQQKLVGLTIEAAMVAALVGMQDPPLDKDDLDALLKIITTDEP